MKCAAARGAAMAGLLAVAAACSGPPSPGSPVIELVADARPPYVRVAGLSDADAAALRAKARSPEEWTTILRVGVAADGPAVLGLYTLDSNALAFTPAFPFDPGRPYYVSFNGARIDGARAADTAAADGPLTATVSLPASTAEPTTVVTRIDPSADTLPENLLRLYIHFSAPMAHGSGISHIELLEADGTVVDGAFLPLDYEFWNPDRTRFTVFLDPGRVKRGILPNRQSGRALKRGRRYTLVVKGTWRDQNGLPLKSEFRRAILAGQADMAPLDTAAWRIEPPRVGAASTSGAAGRDPLVVLFPEPLDRGLLMRALGVRRGGQPLDGEIGVDAGETRWTFTPLQPWTEGRYELVALDILEDLAGNQIGRAFEIDNFDAVDKGPEPKTVTLPFEARR